MKETLNSLAGASGHYEGEGVNHEGQPFIGRLSIQPVLNGRGFAVEFSATGKDGSLYHHETSSIAPSLNGTLTLWNLNTNTPGLVPHELRSMPTPSDNSTSLVFGFNSPAEINAFREEVALEIWKSGDVSYTYSWGMPGGEFKERSGVRMSRKGAGKIALNAIGTVHSSRKEVRDDNWDSENVFIELDRQNFTPEALAGLTDFSHAEVLFFMDQVDPAKVEKVARHPRNNTDWPKVGIFAQRGKNRPNQVGLTICRVLKVDGLKLYLEGLDAVDGTPVLDIKPWVQEFGPRGQIRQPQWITELMQGYWSAE